MSSNQMFSIIIPLFNKELYVNKCIKSVIDQTFSAFELLVVNDGSTDKSVSIVEQFDDSRIKLINQDNSGVSTARNKGAKWANYEYLVFLDADDWWNPSFLAELFILINSYNEAHLFGINYYYVKHGQHRLEPKGLPEDFTSGYIDYVQIYSSSFCVPINCSFVAVRKEAFLKLGGFRSILRFGEDFDLWIRLAITGKVAYLNKPLAYSNQDVELSNRAIGDHKLYPPSAHFVFNLSYLRPVEQETTSLKVLLDGLRVRSLLPYFLTQQYVTQVKSVLSEVDFFKQPFFYRVLYKMPVKLVQFYFKGRKLGSTIKRATLQFIS